MSQRPFSQACENNKQPILDILQNEFHRCKTILEIGSGTGQHAVFFAEQMPWLVWQPSDKAENLSTINAWRDHAALNNLLAAIELDVTQPSWPAENTFDGIFSANTCHIMSWPLVEDFFRGVAKTLMRDGVFCLYGPFNYVNAFTSDSNARFDAWLKQRDPLAGIRDQEAIVALAADFNLKLTGDHTMPANNRLLVFTLS